jgi:hypothetical protein
VAIGGRPSEFPSAGSQQTATKQDLTPGFRVFLDPEFSFFQQLGEKKIA